MITYTCQADGCRRTGTDETQFKKIEYRGEIQFAFVVCLEHAKQYERK